MWCRATIGWTSSANTCESVSSHQAARPEIKRQKSATLKSAKSPSMHSQRWRALINEYALVQTALWTRHIGGMGLFEESVESAGSNSRSCRNHIQRMVSSSSQSDRVNRRHETVSNFIVHVSNGNGTKATHKCWIAAQVLNHADLLSVKVE